MSGRWARVRVDLAALCVAALCLAGAAVVCYGGQQPGGEGLPRTLPVLMYHHVVEAGECNDMTVTAQKLDADLTWLQENGYQTILPRELAEGGPFPDKPVLLTFDDGYRSNYDLLYPLLKKHQMKAVISIIVCKTDQALSGNVSWEMCREMTASGLVEIGSHTYALHNFESQNGGYDPNGPNGVQRLPGESKEDFCGRVLEDLQKSHDQIEAQLGEAVCFFAYPFGATEPWAKAMLEENFPVSVVTKSGMAHPRKGLHELPRLTVTMDTSLADLLG